MQRHVAECCCCFFPFFVLHSAKLYEKWITFGCGRMHFFASIEIGANVKLVESFRFLAMTMHMHFTYFGSVSFSLRLCLWKWDALFSQFAITTDTKKAKCLWLILRAIFVSIQRAVTILFSIHAFRRMFRFFDVSINFKLQPFFDGLLR